MIDTTTIRRTPASLPVSCRFRVAVMKKSVAAFWSGEGPLATSMTHSTPARASARPSPLITSTPSERDIWTTSCPSAVRTSTTCRPTLPVAPATAILMLVLLDGDDDLRSRVALPEIADRLGHLAQRKLPVHDGRDLPGSNKFAYREQIRVAVLRDERSLLSPQYARHHRR